MDVGFWLFFNKYFKHFFLSRHAARTKNIEVVNILMQF